jgi:hypothetical protein
MNKFAEITVIQWKNGKNAETFSSDEDFRTGTYGRELAGKVRITWHDTNVTEWVKSDTLRKLDRLNFEYNAPETDNAPQYVRNVPNMAVTTADGQNTVIMANQNKTDKPTRKPRTTAKQDEA